MSTDRGSSSCYIVNITNDSSEMYDEISYIFYTVKLISPTTLFIVDIGWTKLKFCNF